VSADGVHYVIIDGTQVWYPFQHNVGQEVYRFLARVKFHVQLALQFANFLNAPSYATSLSMALRAHGVRLLCLAGYGEANVASIATPLAFMDPGRSNDQVPTATSPRLSPPRREFTNKLIVKFTEVKASQNKKAMLDSDVNDLIYEETNDHVGAIRAILPDLFSTDPKIKARHSLFHSS